MHIGRSPLNVHSGEADTMLLGTVNVPRVFPSLPVPKPCSSWPCSPIFLTMPPPPRPKMERLLPKTPLGTGKD